MIRIAAYRRTMVVFALVLAATISAPLAGADDYFSLSLPGALFAMTGTAVAMEDDESGSHDFCSCQLCMAALGEERFLPAPIRGAGEQPNSMSLKIKPSNFCSEIFHPPSV